MAFYFLQCLEEMKHFQADFTKHTYIALINAYANCGKFDQAKQVKLMPSTQLSMRILSMFLAHNISFLCKIFDVHNTFGRKLTYAFPH